jgi:uracil-DNA glycosylase family 4
MQFHGFSVKNSSLVRQFARLERRVVSCNLCPRLRTHCETVAREKRRAYVGETYWGRPVPGFGDPTARMVIVGLAPGAHGANRTGRVFTGDRSGEWLYRALHRAGFASAPESRARDDGLVLRDAWVTCAVRCAPPANRPERDELERCTPFLHEELGLLAQARVYVALGAFALASLEGWLRSKRVVAERTRWKFRHGARFELADGRAVLASFHPSQQNTFTGKLTEPMFDAIFRASAEAAKRSPRRP